MRKTRVVAALLMGVFIWTSALTVADQPEPALQPNIDCDVELAQDVLYADREQRAIIKVGLNPRKLSERAPVNLSIVLDRSGSMSGEKLERAKEAAIAALEKLGPRDIFSLVIYAHIVETVVPAQRVRSTERIEAKIRAISSTKGNTALFGGISLAAHEIRRNQDPGYINRIVLLSDGRANEGPSSTDDLGRLAHALQKESISITTVGLGTGYNEDLMTVLAERSDGNTYFVRASEDLPDIFTAELGDVMSVVAQNVSVDIEVPEGITPIRILNRDGRIEDNNIHLTMNQVYGGQERYVLVEVEVPRSHAKGELELANATVSYLNPITRKKEKSSGTAVSKFSGKADVVNKSANQSVQTDVVNNLRAEANDYAIQLADEGKNIAAAEELRYNGRILLNWGLTNKIDSLVEEAKAMEQQADEISSKGMTAENRKSLKAQNFQYRNQQKNLAY